MMHAKILTILGLVILTTPLGCAPKVLKNSLSELYELDTNRYRLETEILKMDIMNNIWREYGEERKLLYHKAKEHCDKNSKRLKVYSLGQQILGVKSGGSLVGTQGVMVGGSSSTPVADAMVIEFGCLDK